MNVCVCVCVYMYMYVCVLENTLCGDHICDLASVTEPVVRFSRNSV